LSAGSTAPTRINDVPTGGPSSSTPTGAASQCSARLTLPIPTAGTVYTALTIPTGMTMKLDVMNYKEEATATGNWSYHLGLHRRTSAGELGTYVQGGSGSTSYYWDGNPWQNHPDFLSFTNTSATDTEFLLALSTNVVVGVPASEGGRIFVDNIRYYDASGNLAGRPCDAEAIQRCQALTPHPLYVASPQTIDGVTYQPGCYEHESCVSDTPIIGFLEEFACEDPFLASIVLTSTVLMIGGVLWVGPRLVALVPSLSSSAGALLAAEGSGGLSMGVSGPQLALGVAVAVMTIAATAYELPVIPDMPSIPAAESLEALGAVPEYLFDAITGTLTQSGDSAVDLVYERVDAEATLPPGLSPEEQWSSLRLPELRRSSSLMKA
jgi:hypothetical protein